jgi:hypothetical protein
VTEAKRKYLLMQAKAQPRLEPTHLHAFTILGQCYSVPNPQGYLTQAYRFDASRRDCGELDNIYCNVKDLIRYVDLPPGPVILDVALDVYYHRPAGWSEVTRYWYPLACDTDDPTDPPPPNRVKIRRDS